MTYWFVKYPLQYNKEGASNGHKVGRQGRRASLNNVPAFTANIYAAATNITNINNKIVI